MSREELEKLTATKLREIAQQYEEITGASAMKKEKLVVAILRARGEPVDETVKDAARIGRIKKQIRTCKAEKEKAQAEKDAARATGLRQQLKRLKRKTRQLAGDKKKKTAKG